MSDSPNQNILSLSLPTDLLTGAGGGSGLSLNYNFGPNVDTLAQNAYGFLSDQFAGAKTFQAASQTGAQNFLSAETQPIVNAVAGESDSYYNQILGAFGNTLNADDCDTLQTMREWRDGWMQETQHRRDMVRHYYLCSPGYVSRISCFADSRQQIIWRELHRLILTACHHIKRGSNELALSYYLAAVEFARACACAGES
jgi:hypothetical protein